MIKKKTLGFIFLSALSLLLAIFLVSYFFWSQNYQNKLIPKTYLGEVDVSKMNKEKVKKFLEGVESEIREDGIKFVYGDSIVYYPLSLQTESADIPDPKLRFADSFSFKTKETIDNLFSRKNNSFFNYIKSQIIKDYKNRTYIKFSYSDSVLKGWLKEKFPLSTNEPESAFFSVEERSGEKVLVNNKEKIGKEINFEKVETDLKEYLGKLKLDEIKITTRSTYPEIDRVKLESLRVAAQDILERDSLSLYIMEDIRNDVEKIDFNVDTEEIITWVSAKKENGELKLTFNKNRIEKYLEDNVSTQINKEVTLPRFDIEDGKVSSWRKGEDGRELNLEKTSENINQALLMGENEVEIIAKELNVEDFDNNDFQIKEIIGTGYSNFAGSPPNRRHNIAVGAEAVHGMLLKPGEEFSLVETLGDINAKTGYLPELVIKGNETIPEYGGGLCQIATTLFRSALASGLPITARRNHSYRVSYYEPAGTDASVYDPWPDIKFLNDTENYVLIQSRIEGSDIYFDFWGTEDGRVATTTDPVIYNIVRPKPTKIIETDELEPGQRKCTESAHNGADAYFDYIVTYPEGATTTPRKEVRFNSHYVPWQEVCLVGKEDVVEKVEDEKTESNETPQTESESNTDENTDVVE